MLGVLLVAIFFVVNSPISWIVANLTLDPSTGYFRQATWDSALYYIGLSPLVGYGFEAHGNEDDFFANATVDSVWLVIALRSGVPLVIFVILANAASFYRYRPSAGIRISDSYMDNMRTAFTLALIIFMFAGLTVHYWNNIWMFWGLCLGIRASLHEQYLNSIRLSAVASRGVPTSLRRPYSHGNAVSS
jgi:O-antigen ligase